MRTYALSWRTCELSAHVRTECAHVRVRLYAYVHGMQPVQIKMARKKRSGTSGQCMVLRWKSAAGKAGRVAAKSGRATEAADQRAAVAERPARGARIREKQLRQTNAKLLQSSAELRQRAAASERRARQAEASILASAEAWAREQGNT